MSDQYIQLFGKDHIRDGTVIEFEEHGRIGGVSTGQGYKFVKEPAETVLVDRANESTTYVGRAALGSSGNTSSAVWQIYRINVVGTVTSYLYADGDDNYNNVWDNRASLTYGATAAASAMLLETGDTLLLETGDQFILES